MMDEMSKWAKSVDLARKFEAAIQTIDIGKGWAVFKGLEKGETTVKVVYDGQVRFLAVKPPKKKAAPKPKKVKKKEPKLAMSNDGSDSKPIFSSHTGGYENISLDVTPKVPRDAGYLVIDGYPLEEKEE